MSAEPLRVAVLGMGWWSDVLADGMKRSDKFEIVSCFTRSEDTIQNLGIRRDLPVRMRPSEVGSHPTRQFNGPASNGAFGLRSRPSLERVGTGEMRRERTFVERQATDGARPSKRSSEYSRACSKLTSACPGRVLVRGPCHRRKVLGSWTQRNCGKECEAADDHDRPDEQRNEQGPMGWHGARRGLQSALGHQ
jgi:hypothetical protein